MARKRKRDVEIFNFSFLDILACTIGLLIFIMVMVFILQSSSRVVDTGALAVNKLRRAQSMHAAASQDQQIADSLEAQFDQVRAPAVMALLPGRDAVRAARDSANAAYQRTQAQVQKTQSRLDSARLARETAVARFGGRDHGLVLLWVRPDGAATMNSAKNALPSSITYGFEPADASWDFATVLH